MCVVVIVVMRIRQSTASAGGAAGRWPRRTARKRQGNARARARLFPRHRNPCGGRLIPLGQTDCQRVLAMLEPVVAATAGRALIATLDDLGSATFRADLASLRHETQYTRLFRS